MISPEALSLVLGIPTTDFVILNEAEVRSLPDLTLICPTYVTPRQLRLALADIDIDPDDIAKEIAKIADVKTKRKAIAEWEYASALFRGHPLVAQIGTVFGLDTAALNALFRTAATYE